MYGEAPLHHSLDCCKVVTKNAIYSVRLTRRSPSYRSDRYIYDGTMRQVRKILINTIS